VVRGPAVYDPRLDSTYPGGSGSQRWDDETTWAFTGSDNPYLQALTWCIGRRANGKLTHGLGVDISAIDLDAFVEGANVCEANSWTCGGVVTSTDKKWDVLVAMLQAGAGSPVRLGGQISCMVSTPRVSLDTITGDDVISRATITGTKARRDRFNRVVPRYRSEDHEWEIVDAAPIKVDAYITEDGGQRTKEIEFSLCQNVDQAAQLAAYAIVDAREFEPITLPLKPKFMGYKAGDCLTVDEPEFGLNSQKVLITSRQIDPSTAAATLTLRSETDAKHAFALGKTGTPPPTPSLTGVDLTIVQPPGVGAFTATGGEVQGASGKIPALFVFGTIDNPNASELLIRYRKTTDTDWTYWPAVDAGGDGAFKRIEITGLADQTNYEVEVAYRNRVRAISSWTALGTHEAGVLTSGEASELLWTIALNYARFDFFSPVNGATAVGVPPAAAFTDFGTQQMAITIPGGSPGLKVEYDWTGTYGLYSAGYVYAIQFRAKTDDAGGSTIRLQARDNLGNPISDLTDQAFSLTTTPTDFSWVFHSDDPDFTGANISFFYNVGDIASGKTVTLTDLAVCPDVAVYPWRPSPDEDALSRYTDIIEPLFVAAREANPGKVIAVRADGKAYEYVAIGPTSVGFIGTTGAVLVRGLVGANATGIVQADASLGIEAIGFITTAVGSGAPVRVYPTGTLSGLTLTAGGVCWLGDAGAVTQTSPSGGALSQRVGQALPSGTELLVRLSDGVPTV
jgi:hypothetical protein